MAAIVIVAAPVLALTGQDSLPAIGCLAGLTGLCATGFADDRRPLDWRLKLLLQALVSLGVALCLPAPVLPGLPAGLATAVAALVLLTMVNIVNFIDGIDEITVAHAAPAAAAAALAALAGLLGFATGAVAAAALGALGGFWLWNRHPARIFLGDAGSLPLGLLLGWLALSLLHAGAWSTAALILFYPLVDGVIALARRARRGAALTQPHRDHAYQRAVDTGVPHRRVAATVALVSAGNAVLALMALLAPHAVVRVGALLVGLAWTLLPVIAWLRRPGR